MLLRQATLEDAPAILAIYAQWMDTPITFEYTLPSLEEFRDRIRETRATYPYLVAEEEGHILGYAYAHQLRERIAYRWAAELSIYLDRSARGRGVGSALYGRLCELLADQGVHMAYGCVTAPNPASEALHRSQGFRLCGTFHESGYKAGTWWDVLWFEKKLGTEGQPPKTLRPAAGGKG